VCQRELAANVTVVHGKNFQKTGVKNRKPRTTQICVALERLTWHQTL
jgi:hypothetical protein